MSGAEIALGAASLLGSGLAYKASSDATNEQRAINRRAGESAQAITEESIQASKEGAEKYQPDQRKAIQEQAERAATESLGGSLIKAQEQPGNPTSQGRVSDEFLLLKSSAATERATRGAKLAQLMAKLKAPSDLRLAENISNADTSSNISGLSGDANSALRAGRVGAGNVSPNAGLQFAGDAARIGGAAYYGNRTRANNIRNTGIYGGKGESLR